ncbi:SseB family protein [Streptomyces fradiae]|uniref:SseB family protein n=1 Tax=Streptomyces fradiae TaxID=1906 RepID=UPI003513686B
MERTGAALAERIAERRRGGDDPRALVGEMRRSVLLVPVADGGLWSVRAGGVRWICGFTDEAALARFALHHGRGDEPMDYAALLGARIVDEIVPSLGEPAGLAVDIATEDGSMFFPPVTGIVPDEAAVDTGATTGEERGDERR